MTMSEVAEFMVKIAESMPEMKVDYFITKNFYKIKFKKDGKYVSGAETLEKLKSIYELNNPKVPWEYFLCDIRDKHIEIFSTYKFV